MNKITITIEAYGKKNTTELSDESRLDEVLRAVTTQFLFLTFPLVTIMEGYKHELEELQDLIDFFREDK